jgi:hypothetical protein
MGVAHPEVLCRAVEVAMRRPQGWEKVLVEMAKSGWEKTMEVGTAG